MHKDQGICKGVCKEYKVRKPRAKPGMKPIKKTPQEEYYELKKRLEK